MKKLEIKKIVGRLVMSPLVRRVPRTCLATVAYTKKP